MTWHIVTGEYPSQPGGVGDYSFLLARGLAQAGGHVHVWIPDHDSSIPFLEHVEVHPLRGGFGLRWLAALHRGIRRYSGRGAVLVQYVPHMYGWKAMNIPFCCWLAIERKRNVWVMFHEVAYPFKPGQPWKHHLLALVHRVMAWSIVRTARQSFTSTERYLSLLRRWSPRKAPTQLLRLFSNVPTNASNLGNGAARHAALTNCRHVVGIFSSFSPATCDLLEPVLPKLLENPNLGVLLIGPGGRLARGRRVAATGRLSALELGPYLQSCDVLLQLYSDGACCARGTFLAALSSGVPLVTNAGPSTEALLLESGAMSFAECAPESVRQAVESLLSDPVAARKLGDRSRLLYEQHFDLSHTVAALHRALQQWS